MKRRGRRRGRRKNYFAYRVAIGAGILAIAAFIYIAGTFFAGKDSENRNQTEEVSVVATEESTVIPTEEATIEETTELQTEEQTELQTEAEEIEETTEVFERSERQKFFDNSLFIGDSRSEGLKQYADLGEADFFTGSGMSVYNIYESKVIVENAQKKTLEEMLSEKKYDTIYLMIGINELGYSYEKTVKRFTSLVEWLQEMEPEAEIVLQANLHMTKEKSETDEIFNNPNINRFNAAVKELAEATGRCYLDVNPLFDDSEGNLSEDYAVDDAHILGKYYADWADWIYEERTEN